MTISGRYWDRLVLYIMPRIALVTIIVTVLKSGRFFVAVLTFISLTLILWLIDSLIIFFKYDKPKTLRIIDECLFLGDRLLDINEIDSILIFEDRRSKWSFDLIEIRLVNDDKFFIINKPVSILDKINDMQSDTISILRDNFPVLSDKILSSATR